MPQVLYSSVKYSGYDPAGTLPGKFGRLLAAAGFAERVKGRSVAVKMHVGRGVGYTTISPLFVKMVTDRVKEAGGRPFITDQTVEDAKTRGYSESLFGCPVLDCCGLLGKYYYEKRVDYKGFTHVDVAGYIHDAEVMVNLSHVKGHGACGYGGACKNIAMGCVTDRTRREIHGLEGGLVWDKNKCTRCNACITGCNHNANKFTESGEYDVFYHNCTLCQHCVKACPAQAITLDSDCYEDFQTGMALCTKEVLGTFAPGDVYHINFLTNITFLCDCWGISTPALVPDIGIMASHDIVALESACLGAIKEENLLKDGLPQGHVMQPGTHLLEKIHAKNPYIQIGKLQGMGLGSDDYTLCEIE
ncbi:MAG: DUF362 domain-containing protein [Oscillospiraceae bacterium]|jgi:uncharacterized Fe-S center protein|nr:DUF362 domain-containing protein [Oscillospiraceae bacterium]